MNLELQIAKRYLFSKKSTNAINIISLVSGLAMLFGTMALLLVLSVFNGLEGLIKSLYTVFYADVAIMPAEGKSFEITPKIQQQLNSISYIDAYSFMLEENALLEYGDRQHICTIRGVDSNYFNVIPKFDSFIIDGKKVLVQDSINYAIIGVGVALKLGTTRGKSLFSRSYFNPPPRFAATSPTRRRFSHNGADKKPMSPATV